MAKTINFCGDSFCASKNQHSWTVKLAEMLDYKILGLGMGGTSHETAIKQFDLKAAVTVFCWTESTRIYFNNLPLCRSTVAKNKDTSAVYNAAHQWFEHLLDVDYQRERQIRDLCWFDRTKLTQYNGLAIHLWCYEKTYDFITGHTVEGLLFNLSKVSSLHTLLNHMPEKTNTLLANKLYKLIRNENG